MPNQNYNHQLKELHQIANDRAKRFLVAEIPAIVIGGLGLLGLMTGEGNRDAAMACVFGGLAAHGVAVFQLHEETGELNLMPMMA